MQMIEIVRAGLEAKGFTGLVVPGTCGCLLDDLSPGNCLSADCEAGYKHTHSQRPADWIVSTNQDDITDADIERCIAECC